MKATNLYKKIIATSVAMGSFLVFGSIYQSYQLADSSFMNDDEVKFVKRLDETRDRYVASAESELAQKYQLAIQYLPKNALNSKIINGRWEITRIEDEKGEEVYNLEKEDKDILVNFEMIGTSLVRINDDANYTFDISILNKTDKSIALFRSFGKGYEIIEAKKVEENTADQFSPRTELAESNVVSRLEEKSSLRVEKTFDLVLERALVPASGVDKVQVGDDKVEGELNVSPEGIDSFTFTVANKNGEPVEYSVEEIKLDNNGAGTFTALVNGVESTGIASNNGKDAYRIRFATGPIERSMLNFTTVEEKDKISEERERTQELLEEKGEEEKAENELVIKQHEVANNRKSVIDASYKSQEEVEEIEEERYEDERELSEEELEQEEGEFFEDELDQEERNEIIEEQGYEF